MLHWLASARAELAGPASRPGALLVDLGCGGGLLAPHAARLGYRHVGVDLTRSALAVASSHAVRAVRADVGSLPLASGCAQVVCAGEILEHVVDLDPVVSEACRVLEPGGRLVIDTIAATRLATLIAVRIGERVPGSAPPGLHDPGLFVDRARLLALAWEHGVALQMRGVRPSVRDTLTWLSGSRTEARMVPTWTTAVLFQAWGTKAAAHQD
jgi:2-polyprenyl-6-hydroxyphenyl methylase/3-demethylubiquinone-9 3-methyltransferase